MTASTLIERTLNACTPPLTVSNERDGYLSITTGRCMIRSSCESCVLYSGSGRICTHVYVSSTWPQHFPHIAQQFPELLL